MDLLSTVLHEMGNAMGFEENFGQGVMSLMLDPGVRTLPATDSGPLGSAALRAEPQSLFSTADAWSPIYVSADRSIDWSQPILDVAKSKKSDLRVAPAWVGDFVNHLARTESERNPNIGIRVHVEGASRVSALLNGR